MMLGDRVIVQFDKDEPEWEGTIVGFVENSYLVCVVVEIDDLSDPFYLNPRVSCLKCVASRYIKLL